MEMQNTKPTGLTDIPLTLEQGDNIQIDTAKRDKLKSNSLKRFLFRVPSPKTADQATAASLERSPETFNLRVGSFHDTEEIKSDTEDSPSSSGSRFSLNKRLSKVWSSVFKKSSNKPSVTDVESQSQSKDTNSAPPSADVTQIENQSNDM